MSIQKFSKSTAVNDPEKFKSPSRSFTVANVARKRHFWIDGDLSKYRGTRSCEKKGNCFIDRR